MALNGWNPNGGVLNTSLQLKGSNITGDLSCSKVTDQFSVSNPSAQLSYKIGLLTVDEVNILNNQQVARTGKRYWLGSPCCFDYGRGCLLSVNPTGNTDDSPVSSAFGVRPVITLKSKTTYISGDGSMADPYVVDTD